MFEQSLVPKGRARPTWTIAVALLGQSLLVGVLIAISMLFGPALPPPEFAATALTLAAPPPPPPTSRPSPHPARIEKTVRRRFNPDVLIAPRNIPKYVAKVNELPPPPVNGVVGGIPGGIPGGQVGGVIGSILSSVPRPLPPPPPVEVRPAVTSKLPTPGRVHVGGNVEAGLLVHEVTPVYPLLARNARIGGLVRMKAVIGRHGDIKDLTVISGHPLLVKAALDAVKQWVYKPTYLNGTPVEVETEIDVHFNLAS